MEVLILAATTIVLIQLLSFYIIHNFNFKHSYKLVIITNFILLYFMCSAIFSVGYRYGNKAITRTSCFKYIVEHDEIITSKYNLVPKK